MPLCRGRRWACATIEPTWASVGLTSRFTLGPGYVNRRFIPCGLSISATWGESIMETNPVEITDLSQLSARQDRHFQTLMAAIENSKIEVAELSAAALRGVL